MLDWPAVMAILGTMVILAGFFFKWFKKPDNKWQEGHQKQELRITKLEGDLENLNDKHDNLHEELDDLAKSTAKASERLENKIEKLTDLMIQYISDKSRGN